VAKTQRMESMLKTLICKVDSLTQSNSAMKRHRNASNNGHYGTSNPSERTGTGTFLPSQMAGAKKKKKKKKGSDLGNGRIAANRLQVGVKDSLGIM